VELFELLRRIDGELVDFQNVKFDVFIRSDRAGAHYTVEQAGGKSHGAPSATNTAALFALAMEHPTFVSEELWDSIDGWVDGVLLPEVGARLPDLDDRKKRNEAAYRLGQLQRALNSSDLRKRLHRWLTKVLDEWLVRERPIAPSIFVVHLADPPKTGRLSQRVHAFAEHVIARQVAAGASNDWADFNAIDLALALALVRSSAISPSLLKSAIKILNVFAEREAIWKSPSSPPLSGISSVGCSSLFACAQLVMRGDPAVVSALEPAFISHLDWFFAARSADYRMSTTLPTDPRKFSGWRGSDLPDRSADPETWFNCLSIEFLEAMRAFLGGRVEQRLKNAYRAQSSEAFMSLGALALDPKVATALSTLFIQPMRAKRPEYFTAILYGPPGTAKTTIAAAIAHDIEWPLIELGVGDFLSRGLEEVFSRATEIFEDLLQLSRVVILLDEVEQVFKNRSDETDLRQKFLTSALLPPLKRIRDNKKVVLLIATNFIRDFDEAAKRAGRIDLVLPIGTPSLAQRRTLISKMLPGYPPSKVQELAEVLPDGTTIQDIKSMKRVANYVTRSASDLYGDWKKNFAGPSVSPEQLAQFDADKAYARYR
jgi:ATPase family associated with various cellular activities (AAA)